MRESSIHSGQFKVTKSISNNSFISRGRYFAKENPKNAPGGINSAEAKFLEYLKLSGSTP